MTIYATSCPQSSFIKTVGWDSSNGNLLIQFATGTVWLYRNVSKKHYTNIISAPSAGVYFNINIRDIYSSERVSYSDYFKGTSLEQEE